MLKKMNGILISIIILSWLLAGVISESHAGSDHAEQSAIKSDSVPVHSQMSSRSRVVQNLQKGDVVVVEIKVSSQEGDWCGIRKEGQKKLLGYVKCSELEREISRKESWKLIKSVTVKDNRTEKSAGQEAVQPAAKKRPYSDITAILYMTTW